MLLHGCAQQEIQHYSESAHLRILHWNDFHAHNIPYEVTVTDSTAGTKVAYKVGGAGNFLGYLKQFGKGRSDVAVLNAGDNFQGTPISSLTFGRSQVELLNIINPDAMVLGNHEFDYGLQHLRDDMSIASFPILAANLFDSTTG
jgi:2',3'-cyclic-nucleotide 2'-phosphodiesterase (5'-nucleotidase family)